METRLRSMFSSVKKAIIAVKIPENRNKQNYKYNCLKVKAKKMKTHDDDDDIV